MGKLVLRLPDGSRREYPLERERLTIGRRADNDICLPSPAVSGEHAAIVTILADSFLEDLNSTNGTLVNGKPVTKHFLRDHDEIDIGRHIFVYLCADYVSPPPSSLSLNGETVAVTANGGATIGDDAATVVYPTRPRTVADEMATASSSPTEAAEVEGFAGNAAPTGAQPVAVVRDRATRNESPAERPALEVLDGPRAGDSVQVSHDDFVVGRPGKQIAAVRRTPEGFRLVPIEGETPPRINGAAVSAEGAVLIAGDEIDIADTRLAYRLPR